MRVDKVLATARKATLADLLDAYLKRATLVSVCLIALSSESKHVPITVAGFDLDLFFAHNLTSAVAIGLDLGASILDVLQASAVELEESAL